MKERFIKIAAVVVAAMMLMCTAACGMKEKNGDGRLTVVCTIFPQYDFVREIAGDKADVRMLVPFGVESHDFGLESLTVADLSLVGRSDLVIFVGGESDEMWIEKIKSSVKDHAEWMALTDIVTGLTEITSASMEEEEDKGEEEYDEHVWTSPKRAAVIVSAITEKLCSLDSVNASFYRSNCEKYLSQLGELDNELTAISEKAKTKTLVFADRFPFRYLCADYGFSFDAAFPACSSSADPSALQITSLCRTARESNAGVIFHMENSKTVYAEKIAESVGAKVMLLHSCHTLTEKEFSSGKNYISIMKQNISNISEAVS